MSHYFKGRETWKAEGRGRTTVGGYWGPNRQAARARAWHGIWQVLLGPPVFPPPLPLSRAAEFQCMFSQGQGSREGRATSVPQK